MNPSPRVHIPSLLQFALSGLTLMVTLPVAIFTVVMVLAALFSGQGVELQPVALLSVAWTGLFISLLMLPGAALALFRLFGSTPPRLLRVSPLRAASLALFAWPLVLLAGWMSSTQEVLTWLVLPPLQVLAVALPVWWFIEVGRHKLPWGSSQRGWGVLTLGMVLGPSLAMIIELLLLVVVIIAFILWVASQPALTQELMQLGERLQGIDPQSPRALDLLRPYFARPAVLAVLAGTVAGAVPLIEELVKPLPVLILALWRKIPPAEGFAAGLVAGGAFGLVESLGMAANLQGADWAPVLATRVGTGLLHIVTTALVGWGLASALREKRWLRLLLTYLAAVSLHGLWNLMAVVVGVNSLNLGAQVGPLAVGAAVVLGLLAMGLYAILVRMNRRLRAVEVPRVDVP
jgi:hypothetical protein